MNLNKNTKNQYYINFNNKKYNIDNFVNEISQGNRSFLSRAITIIDSCLEKDNILSQEILKKCLKKPIKSIRVGISGIPGVGKSTLIESLGKIVIDKGYKLAVLTVDPSSLNSKGSILGDKVRMGELSKSENVFIRTTPASNILGGVARGTRESVMLCETAGYDVIFVETVGVGQSEVDVHSMVDFFLLLQIVGAGDELQGVKKGIMEIVDCIVINKADGENRAKAAKIASDFNKILEASFIRESEWYPKALIASSFDNYGIEQIWSVILKHNKVINKNGFFIKKRQEQYLQWMQEITNHKIYNDFYGNKDVKLLINNLKKDILNNKINIFDASDKLLNTYKRHLK